MPVPHPGESSQPQAPEEEEDEEILSDDEDEGEEEQEESQILIPEECVPPDSQPLFGQEGFEEEDMPIEDEDFPLTQVEVIQIDEDSPKDDQDECEGHDLEELTKSPNNASGSASHELDAQEVMNHDHGDPKEARLEELSQKLALAKKEMTALCFGRC